jgi:hypothetical protein
MIGLTDINEMIRLSSNGGGVLYAALGCIVFVFGTISSVCLKAALKNRKLNKRNEKAVKMQEVIVESLKQNEIAQKNRNGVVDLEAQNDPIL